MIISLKSHHLEITTANIIVLFIHLKWLTMPVRHKGIILRMRREELMWMSNQLKHSLIGNRLHMAVQLSQPSLRSHTCMCAYTCDSYVLTAWAAEMYALFLQPVVIVIVACLPLKCCSSSVFSVSWTCF